METYSCIYKITCLPTSKFYIGSTNDWRVRFQTHKAKLRSGKHTNPYLLNAFKKYKEDNFTFKVIETIFNEDDLLQIEQKWLDKTQCYKRHIGFNIANQVNFTEYAIDANSKKYIITKPDGKEIIIKNLHKFCRKNKLNPGALSQVAQGNVNQHKNYLCRYASMSKEEWQMSLKRSHKSGGGHKGDWLITDPQGNKYHIESLTDFCKKNNLSQGNMTEVSKGKRKQHKGYTCKTICRAL